MATIHPQATRVFDAIENNNVSLAERTLEPALAAAPNDHSLRAAKALLCYTQREHDEAIETALALAADNPTEPRTVAALVHVLQQTCQWQAVIATYQRVIPTFASSGHGIDRSALENLTLTLARMHRYSEMQKECAKLQKETGDIRFTVWGAMANLSSVAPGDSTSIILKVVARVLDKQVLSADEKVLKVTPEHCAMYLEALERQGAFTEARYFIASQRFRALGPADRLMQYAKFSQLAGDKELAAAVLRHLWTSDPENWTFFSNYVDVLDLLLNDKTLDASELTRERAVQFEQQETLTVTVLKAGEKSAFDVVRTIGQAQKDGQIPRGLMLAEMELLHRFDVVGKLDKVREYCKMFASKPSCFLDVIKYIPHGANADWTALLAPTLPRAEWIVGDHARNALRLQLVGAIDKDIPKSDKHTQKFLKEILDALHECPQPTEVGESAHPWPLLLATACNAVARRLHAVPDETTRRAWASIGFRITSLAPKGHKFPMAYLFAILFAHRLGLECTASVNALDFKSVQLDSMAFLCLRPLRDSHDMVRSFHYAAHADRWYGQFERDTGNLVAKAFHNGAWTQLRNLESFEAAIANSVSRAEWYALYAALSTLSSENQASLIATLRRLRSIQDVLRVDPANAVANDDRSSVAIAALQELPDSEYQQALLETLMPTESNPQARTRAAHGVCAFFLVLRDLALYITRMNAAKQAAAGAGRKGKKDKNAAADAAATANAGPRFLVATDATLISRAEGVSGSEVMLPFMRLVEAIVITDTVTPALVEGVDQALHAFIQRLAEPSVAALRRAVWPYLPIFVSALRVLSPLATKFGLPVRTWAASLSAALHAAEDRALQLSTLTLDKEDVNFKPAELKLDTRDANAALNGLQLNVFLNLATTMKAATIELDTLKNMK
jgi:tetratricopeptide (TPR) repeat protein